MFAVERLHNCNYAALIAQAVSGDKMSRPRLFQARQGQLVGRESLLSIVRAAALRLLQTGDSGTVMITADAGFGKTRLLQHFLNDEDICGFRSSFHISMACGQRELSPVPLTPWKGAVKVCFMISVLSHMSMVSGCQSICLVWNSFPDFCRANGLSCVNRSQGLFVSLAASIFLYVTR